MKAFIIAAGLGSRLRPYTKNLPKCLVNIGNKTILDSQLEVYRSLNIKREQEKLTTYDKILSKRLDYLIKLLSIS